MKLRDLAKELNPDGYVIDLYEVFDTTREINWYEENGRKCGEFEVNGRQFRVLLETISYQNKYNCINIAFQILDTDGEWTTSPTYDNKSASIVMGVVVNAISRKVRDFEYDALVFFANDNVDKRMRIYNSIARWKMKDLGKIIENIPLPDGRLCTVVISPKIENTDQFVQFLEKIKSK